MPGGPRQDSVACFGPRPWEPRERKAGVSERVTRHHLLGSQPVIWIPREGLGQMTEAASQQSDLVVEFYGILRGRHGFLTSDELAAEGRTLVDADLLAGTGEWFAIVERHGLGGPVYEVVTDFHAFQRVYVAAVESGGKQFWTISGDFDTLAAIKAAEGHRQVAWDYVLPTLTSNHNFLTGRWAHGTWHAGIAAVDPGRRVILDGRSRWEVPRDFERDSSDRSYDDLIDQGIEGAVAELQALAARFPNEPLAIFLSGGRDSRMCLALALEAGLSDRIRIVSEDPAKFAPGKSRQIVANDLVVATEIRARYGLKFLEPAARAGDPLTFDESLREFQRRKSGASFEFRAETMMVRQPTSITEIRGAGGELIRTQYEGYADAPWWHRLIRNVPASFVADARALFGVVTRGHLLPRSQYLRSRSHFVEALSLHPGAPLDEQLSVHCSYFRNRAHFGSTAEAFRAGRRVSYPLCQPEFNFAAQLLSHGERRDGELAFDILERLEPALNRIVFDNAPGWPVSLYSRRGLDPVAGSLSDIAAARAEELAESNRFVASVSAAQRLPNRGFRGDRRSYGEAWSRGALQVIAEQAPDVMTPELMRGLLDMLESRALNSLETAARCRSLLSIMGQVSVSDANFVVRSAPPLTTDLSEPALVPLRSTLSSFENSCIGFDMEVRGERSDEGVRIVASVIGLVSAETQFACYLKAGESIVARTPYQDESCFVFSKEQAAEADRAMVFVKRRSDPAFLLRQEVSL